VRISARVAANSVVQRGGIGCDQGLVIWVKGCAHDWIREGPTYISKPLVTAY
jgi:hypothetical protein